MNNYELNKLKRKLVHKAWQNEKLMISRGEGTRNWSVAQQDSILKYNIVSGYVGQFLNSDSDESKMKVQLLEMSIEFLSAHSVERNNPKLGVINTQTYSISPFSDIRTVKLSDALYVGYLQTHRYLFIGQDTGFGVKITKEDAKSEFQKNKFGVDDINSSIQSEEDHARERMNKYGF